MTEDQLEQEALGWLASVGYTPLNARDLDHLDPRLERASTREVVLAVMQSSHARFVLGQRLLESGHHRGGVLPRFFQVGSPLGFCWGDGLFPSVELVWCEFVDLAT